jgi:hypothetical protein
MSMANPIWGAPRIHGELLMLGIEVSLATVVRYMPWRPKVPSPTWRSFLHNHMHNMARGSHEVVLVISQPSHAGLNPPGQEIGRLT